MITTLTGMEVSNASMYDGASALAEAAMMASGTTKRKKVIVSKSVHPEYREVLKTYLSFQNIELCEIETTCGVTDIEYLKSSLDSNTSCVIIQNPNFFGIIEDMEEIEQITHTNKSLLVMNVNPISLGLLTPPGEYGADIVAGEAQPLGNALNFGGPYLGFIAVNKALVRKMPGRICGMTNDIEGKRAFVLTLQAREQHIRREKSTSNICSNQALNALNATIYLSTLGKAGLHEVALQCTKKAHYLAKLITAGGKYRLLFDKPFFHEFAILLGDVSTSKMNNYLMNRSILGGYDISKNYPQYKNSTLLCVTEKRTQTEMENLVKSMEGIV
jgi:glycine dehydrogenase subunit 1